MTLSSFLRTAPNHHKGGQKQQDRIDAKDGIFTPGDVEDDRAEHQHPQPVSTSSQDCS